MIISDSGEIIASESVVEIVRHGVEPPIRLHEAGIGRSCPARLELHHGGGAPKRILREAFAIEGRDGGGEC